MNGPFPYLRLRVCAIVLLHLAAVFFGVLGTLFRSPVLVGLTVVAAVVGLVIAFQWWLTHEEEP